MSNTITYGYYNLTCNWWLLFSQNTHFLKGTTKRWTQNMFTLIFTNKHLPFYSWNSSPPLFFVEMWFIWKHTKKRLPQVLKFKQHDEQEFKMGKVSLLVWPTYLKNVDREMKKVLYICSLVYEFGLIVHKLNQYIFKSSSFFFFFVRFTYQFSWFSHVKITNELFFCDFYIFFMFWSILCLI